MLKKLFFVLLSLMAVLPVTAGEDYRFALKGNIDPNNTYDWVIFELTEKENGVWTSEPTTFKAGPFGVAKLDQSNEQIFWYNYSGEAPNDDNVGKADIASNDLGGVTLCIDDVNQFYLNNGGEWVFVFDTTSNPPTVAFINKSEQTDPEPDPTPGVTDLYLIHSKMDGDWTAHNPEKLTYDVKTGIYSYTLPEACTFGVSLSSTNDNWSFWGGDFVIRKKTELDYENVNQVARKVVHFAEPQYYNIEKGAPWDENKADNFESYCGGTLKIKYDGKNGLGKIWIEPVEWPDLYISGAIIAESDDKQKEGADPGSKEGTSQWGYNVKMKNEGNGLYSYVLGEIECDKETGYYNINPFIAEINRDGDFENEIGHFNFSFIDNIEGAWQDYFAPIGGMGNLSRYGEPFDYEYHDHYPAREKNPGGWVSTNFVFKEQCKVWVNARSQVVWVELCERKLSDTDVMFTFWDKRGETYPADLYDYLRWWGTGNLTSDDYEVELVVFEGNDPKGKVKASEKLSNDAWTLSVHSKDGKTDGIYHGISSTLTNDFIKETGYDENVVKDYLWVKIYNKSNAKYPGRYILRPYIDNAIYTQAIGENPEYNNYGDITEGEMNVTMTPDLRVIPNATEAQRMTGGFNDETTIVYPAVNQYQTVINFNDPFTVEGDVQFNKTYAIQGYVGDTKFSTTDKTGSMTQIRLTGVNHTDETLNNFDKIFVEINYESDGMIFSRSYERILRVFDWKDDVDEDAKASYFELPVMNGGEEDEKNLDKETYGFVRTTGHDDSGNGEVDGGHWTVDLILHKQFTFRDQMINNRAAYIRYTIEELEVNVDGEWKPYNGECLLEHGLLDEDVFAAQNGVPLTWNYNDNTNALSENLWYQEAFLNQQLDIELRHVLCAETQDKLKGAVRGKVVYELIVPIADEVKAYFEDTTDDTSKLQLRKANELTGPEVDDYVPGYDYDAGDDTKNGYSGTLSAPADDNENNIANKYKDEYPFTYSYDPNDVLVSGVEDVAVEPSEASEEFEYFNLQGIRLNSESLAPGIYIRRSSNGTTTKIYVK